MADRQNCTAEKKADLTIGLVGNPNCGKTTLFNALTGSRLKTANWPGVTVERVEGELIYEGLLIRIVDLPGTYSLDSYTIEEQITRKYVESGEADVLINVADSSLLERSLYLTLQLLERKKPVVLALNMIDVVKARGMEIDEKCLWEMLGQIPIVSLSARKGKGLENLLDAAVCCQEKAGRAHPVKNPVFGSRPGNRSFDEESRYACIEKITENCLISGERENSVTDIMDQYLTHRILGVPIFLGIMMLVFFLTFTAGDFLKKYFQWGLDGFSRTVLSILQSSHCADWVTSLVIDGIVAGVGGILTFLPNILILFTALAILEDSGYMARAAYVMNEIMGLAGLSGRAFLPLLLGFGCTVPAVMAARILPNAKDRKRTIFITPFMSCSAKLPVYVLFAGMFFPDRALPVMGSLYAAGLGAGILTAFFIHRGEKDEENPLLIELPQYRMPDARTVSVYVGDKIRDYLCKAGTTIFIASIVLWFLLNTGVTGFVTDISHSFAAMAGQMAEPLFSPCGLGNWRITVALLSGLSAKEVVVSSLSILYGIGNMSSPAGMAELSGALAKEGFGGLNAYGMLIFCLFYTPCIAAIGTVRKETDSIICAAGMAVFQFAVAWGAAALIYQIGRMLL